MPVTLGYMHVEGPWAPIPPSSDTTTATLVVPEYPEHLCGGCGGDGMQVDNRELLVVCPICGGTGVWDRPKPYRPFYWTNVDVPGGWYAFPQITC